jgi:hypothetical protein
MRAVIRALWAEALKLRRTLALRLAVIVPLALIALNALVAYQRGPASFRGAENVWLQTMHEVFYFSSLMMLPLFIALQATLVADVEHSSAGWKHLYALPIPRWAVYAAKQIAALALVGLSVGLLAGFTVLAGLALQALKPEMGFEPHVPWRQLLNYAGEVYLSSWLMLALHTWIGVRWPGFVLPLGVGVLATFLALVVGDTGFGRVFPWSLPQAVAEALSRGALAWGAVAWGGLGGIAAAILGCWAVIRREVL